MQEEVLGSSLKETTVASQEETIEQVKRANERFYRAFESLDISKMADMWLQAERAKCASGLESAQWLGGHSPELGGDFCQHGLHAFRDNRCRGAPLWASRLGHRMENLSDAPDTLQMARILATNVFEHTGEAWRMVHHHASPIMRPAPALGEGDPEFLN